MPRRNLWATAFVGHMEPRLEKEHLTGRLERGRAFLGSLATKNDGATP